jgi:hypothetical protein
MADIKLQGWTLFCVVLLVGVGVWQVASMVPGSPIPGIDDLLTGDVGGTTDPTWEKPDDLGEDSHRVIVEIPVQEQDTGTAGAGSVYIWFDADGDSVVDVGEDGLGSAGSEVESVTIVSGTATSGRTYWTGSTIGIQSHCTGMYVDYAERVVPDLGLFDTSVPVTTVFVRDIYTTATAAANDQGANALATGTDYNYTASGTTLTMTVRLSITAGGEGFGQLAYTDWDTGYTYTGPFCSILVDNTDTDLVFDASTYDVTDERGGYIYYIIYLEPFFNDADVTSDGFISFNVVIDILGAGDFDVNFYDYIRTDNFNAYSFGSADATISDIDIVA